METVESTATRASQEEATTPSPEPTEPPPPEPIEPAPPESTEPPPEPKTYRMGIFGDLTTTNYWAYLDTDSSVWNDYVLSALGPPSFWSLVYPDILFVPYMARELPTKIVREGDLWVQTIEIWPGVTWSDGTEVTVNDFVFTAETAMDLGLGGNWLDSFDADYVHHFEVIDDYTVKIYYSQQPGLNVSQVGGIGFAPWMPKHFWEDWVAEAARSDDPATFLYAVDGMESPSIGGFVLTGWQAGAFVELTAREDGFFNGARHVFYENGAYYEGNENYEFCVYGDCSGAVKLQYTNGHKVSNVIYTIYGTQDAAVLAMINGEVDFLLNPNGLPSGLREQVVNNPDLDALQNPTNRLRYLAFNMRKSPNWHKGFRQAVAILIDKEYIAGSALQNTAIPAYSMVPESNVFWFNADVPAIGKGLTREERLVQAMELLKADGFGWDIEPRWSPEEGVVIPGSTLKDPDGNELEGIELLAPGAGYDPMRATAAVLIAQWCNELGIPVEPNLTGFDTIIPQVFEPDPETGEIEFDWYILGWGLGNPAWPGFHETFLACANDAKDGGLNAPGYCSEEFEELAADFRAAQTLDDARDAVRTMDALLANDLPIVTLFTAPILEFYAKARVDYPFTDTLDGLQNLNGLPDLAAAK
jgi:peptide/nickel transport system substrate-binding protein